MTQLQSTDKPPVTIWQVVMLFLSVYVIGALFVNTVFRLPPQVSVLLDMFDYAVCLAFIADFLFQLATAESKVGYLKWGWIDLISSIPSLEVFRWGRFVQIVRVVRVLRGVRATKLIVQFLFANRAQGTFASVAMITFIVMVFSSIAILDLETSPDANIQTASDALWWSFVTITTVGYGDYYPITMLGRVIAAVLMTVGVGLFGTFTAYVATFFLQPQQETTASIEQDLLLELRAIRVRLDHLEANKATPPAHLNL